MKFKSKAERMAHPQARLIPESLWNNPLFFDRDLPDYLISLMQEADESIITAYSQAERFINYYKRKCAWLAIALSHPNLSIQTLQQLGGLPDNTVFSLAAAWGNKVFFETLANDYLIQNQLQDMIAVDNYLVFRVAAENGHLEVLRYLEDKAPAQLQAMIAADNYFAFRFAAQNGHLEVLRYLGEKAPAQLQAMIAADNYFAFRFAAQNGHLEVLRYLGDKAPAQLQAMITVTDYFAFRVAALTGDLEVLRYLEAKAPAQLQAMITVTDYSAFRFAAANGHLEVLRYLEAKAPGQLQAMITADDYFAFRVAAANGHLEVLQYLEAKAPAQLQAMIAAGGYSAFRVAAQNGHLEVLRYLGEKVPAQLQAMITVTDYSAFRFAAENGHLEVLRYLEAKAPGQLQAMIAAGGYFAFRVAAENDHLEVLRYLEAKAPGQLQAMIAAGGYFAFRFAAQNGHLEVLQYLEAKAPAQLQAMIAAGGYFAFRFSAQNGHLEVLRYLEAKAPGQLQAMIAADNYFAFQEAAQNGHPEVLRYLEEQAPDQLQGMITANDYRAFQQAANCNHVTVVNHLLLYPAAFAYAEQHTHEYGETYVIPFVTEKLTALRVQKLEMEQDRPNAVFDMADAEEARLCFYMLRNLIRRNDAGLLDDIRFLLDIPAVKRLAHTAVTPRVPNELVRLAITTGNQAAAEVLLTIPAIRALAEQNDYYRSEARGGWDLRALARDRESSMHALSTGEQKRLQRATDRYQPMIKTAGVHNLMDELRALLETRYRHDPAKITRDDGSELVLPQDWREFKALIPLSPEETEHALKAYYQNKDHTVLRYLSKPNPWMHETASYVEVNDNHTERWSTFEDHQPLIALFFLAAQDSEIRCIDGYTVETRTAHFIDELAHIGRAHNWDKTRVRYDAAGAPILNDEGEPTTEEYDDLEGDRPSCVSGVKRRLFQSVLGHPLLKMLTKEGIDEEIRDFVRLHFKARIDDQNRDSLKIAWDRIIAGDGTDDDKLLLKTLDVSLTQQVDFIGFLVAKYGEQFTSERGFTQQIRLAFQITAQNDSHPLNFGHLNWQQFLEPPTRGPGNACFFATSPQPQSDSLGDTPTMGPSTSNL